MKAIHWLLVGLLATVALAVVACAAPPAWVAPSKPVTLIWTPSSCPPAGNCRPFTYCLFTNDVLVTANISETATNYVIASEPPGITEYALAASNAAGRSACAVAIGTNDAPTALASQPVVIRKQ
jgi:hypothetical protein